MSLLQTFGDAITNLQTDPSTGQPRQNELDIAETLFNNLSDKYKQKEQADQTVNPSSHISRPNPGSIRSMLKKSILLACLAVVFSLPASKEAIFKFTQKTWLTYLVMFVIAFMVSFIILKWIS